MTGRVSEPSLGRRPSDNLRLDRPLSILHVVAPAAFGGLESVLRGLAAGQTRFGHSVRVALILSPDDGGNPFAAALEADGTATSRIHVGNRDYLGERKAVLALSHRDRPDIVHTHGFRPDVVDGSLMRSEGIPVVSTCHGFIDSNLRGRVYQWVQRRALRHFDAVIAVSEPIARRVRSAGVPSSRVHLIRNAYSPAGETLTREDARRRLDLPDGPLIGWIGRLSPEKGPDIALDAFACLNRPNTRLVMIGGGSNEASLRRRAEVLGVADRVLWRGFIPDAGRILPAFDAFLLSSRMEGTPVVLLEAMAARVPIVATRVGGVPDTVDQASAFLVDCNQVAEIASAVAAVFDNPDLASDRAERAHSRLEEQFGVGPWLLRYESVYRGVLPTVARTRPRERGQ